MPKKEFPVDLFLNERLLKQILMEEGLNPKEPSQGQVMVYCSIPYEGHQVGIFIDHDHPIGYIVQPGNRLKGNDKTLITLRANGTVVDRHPVLFFSEIRKRIRQVNQSLNLGVINPGVIWGHIENKYQQVIDSRYKTSSGKVSKNLHPLFHLFESDERFTYFSEHRNLEPEKIDPEPHRQSYGRSRW